MNGFQGTDLEVQGQPHLENMHPTPTLQDVMQAIVASWEALKQNIDAMSTDLGLPRYDHRHLVERVAATERELSATTPAITVASNRWNEAERRLKNDNLVTENHKVRIFPNFSKEVQRADFSTAKKKLRDLELEYSM
ncbi:hypothetical protein NDU88_005788 [Pleurodeles waltl]|uniref:Dystrophin n=1 Tax=Pleurodeles waltl TaxID=8319 RepID=A0AAV7NNF4_PLEWA|nr:hypothetical protein NDU88_005788 [Pleurodeles waltl]